MSLNAADTLLIDNSVLWDNIPDSIAGIGTIQVSYSNIEFGWPGCDFCILDAPIFVDPDGKNYRLAPDSPGIDSGNNNAVPEGMENDLDGSPRFVDDPDTPDCPQPGADCGDPPIVDIGAYEFIPCPWDLNDDCVVGVGDLLILLAEWSNPYGVPEMLLLLADWGPCQCDPLAEVLSLEDELADACLTEDEWDEYVDVMTDGDSSQADKDRYDCWMTHYMMHCDKCTCTHIPLCPSPDPFS